jgi:hypothetical protein
MSTEVPNQPDDCWRAPGAQNFHDLVSNTSELRRSVLDARWRVHPQWVSLAGASASRMSCGQAHTRGPERKVGVWGVCSPFARTVCPEFSSQHPPARVASPHAPRCPEIEVPIDYIRAE